MHTTDTRFEQFTAPASDDAPKGTPDGSIYARISDGEDDTVRTLTGEQQVSKGDAVVEVGDRPGIYDVIPAAVWSDLDWKGKSTASKSAPAKKTAAPARKTAAKTAAGKR
jgi:hypothetical protein